ncbi:MAG: serine/threonine protein kinase [Sphaerospermopsis sp. SIO1G1]|nr:serine/threonine protein kinase [Sphaerospermopsis sp. SIO1G1]
MTLAEVQDILNQQLLSLENRCLNATELIVLQGILKNQTYQEIADKEGYSLSYFANVVAPELYRRISAVTGKRVTKKNCQAILQSYLTVQTQPITNQNNLEQKNLSVTPQPLFQSNVVKERLDNSYNFTKKSISPGYPSGAVAVNSPFYVQQPFLEQQIIEEITKPGSLVRIKAPQKMGKTSLLLRVLDNCEKSLGYKTISVNLQKADRSILKDIDQLLRWLCINCARQLGIKANLDEYWDEDLGSKMSWTVYFEEYILEEIDAPLVLALDEVNKVFENPQVAEEFFPLLRSCYEEAKRSSLWQKFRLIVVHCTNIYIPLQLEQSPFNIGLPIELQFFHQQQVEQLARQYQLNTQNREEIRQLIKLVGGHPALIHLTIYHLSQEKISIRELLANATTNMGIYSHHLQNLWLTLQSQPELSPAFQKVCKTDEEVLLDQITGYKLNSMGLIIFIGNKAKVSCQLYKEYFQNQWQRIQM